MPPEHYTPAQRAALQAVQNLASTCQYDPVHIHHVTRLSLSLFDELSDLHDLNDTERFWLESAALLHDIGWVDGQQGHHKASLQIILTTPLLPFENRERLIIGSIARYHRKALPRLAHDHYAALKPDDRSIVDRLAALLRLADGLDHNHRAAIQRLTCELKKRKVILRYQALANLPIDEDYARAKADLFEQVFERSLALKAVKRF